MFCAILTRDSLDALFDGRLRGRSLRAVRAHLAQPCDACLDLLESEELSPFLERACRGESERAWTQLTEVQRESVVHTIISGRSTDILVADEDSSVPNGLAAILREAGHKCEVTSSAEQALAVAEATAPSLIIAGTNLIGRDGVRLLEACRARFPRACVISLSSNPDVDEAQNCLRSGAVDYLFKPVDRGDLLRAVERAVERRRMKLAREQSKALRKMRRDALNRFTPSHYISDDIPVRELVSGDPMRTWDRAETKGLPLGTKQARERFSTVSSEKYPVGLRVKGKVRGRCRNGLIVDIEQGVDGLVYWTDFAWSGKYMCSQGELLRPGDENRGRRAQHFQRG